MIASPNNGGNATGVTMLSLTIIACVLFYEPSPDEDGDGYGVAAPGHEGQYESDELDCDDSDPEINPAAEELCDGIDNNCDDEIDETCADTATT